jgi:hypothetical protein
MSFIGRNLSPKGATIALTADVAVRVGTTATSRDSQLAARTTSLALSYLLHSVSNIGVRVIGIGIGVKRWRPPQRTFD